uniref:Transmembrane protein n=1 Tax=Knipowitschia caucasica TaxID=637954 RepID=A0AAV2LEF0_KNICA
MGWGGGGVYGEKKDKSMGGRNMKGVKRRNKGGEKIWGEGVKGIFGKGFGVVGVWVVVGIVGGGGGFLLSGVFDWLVRMRLGCRGVEKDELEV